MSDSVERKLAKTFYSCFVESFAAECETDKATLLPLWREKSSWTRHMLDPDIGFLIRTARKWADRNWNERCTSRNEWLKFDLMLVDPTAGKEWWLTVPVVTIEHENDNGIHDEVWKLACWKSRLKVLVTYHNHEGQASEKRAAAKRIIANIQRTYDSDAAEWLLLSAPRDWIGQLGWLAHDWDGSDWRQITPTTP